MPNNFIGKRAVVTAATRGIGKDIAIQLAHYGAKVVAIDRYKDELELLKIEVADITTIHLDVNDWNKTEEAFKNIGNIDLMVNSGGMGWVKPMTEITEADCDRILCTNAKTVIHLTKLAVKNMLDRHVPGAIVNVSSLAAISGLLHHTVYCASKGAVDAFTRACALEFGSYNIRINTVNPTVILTDKGRELWSEFRVAEPFIKRTPLGRFCEVREVTDAVLFLLSDQSSMVTGISLPVDGGYANT